MPKALSPAPYVPSGAGAAGRPGLPALSGASGWASASPVTVSALSHYSSSTTGPLDELQICSLDSPGTSATPSPTLSHVSAYTSTAAAATVTNVIIPTSHRYNTQMVPGLPKLIWMAGPNLYKMCFPYLHLSLTSDCNLVILLSC